MVYTVTLNPCVDKTVEVARLERGGLNRVSTARIDPAGKGINVSRVLKLLGVHSVPLGFLAGQAGHFIYESMTAMDLEPDFAWLPGETRTNLKIVEPGGVLTEINESGPPVGDGALASLMAKLEELLRPDDWVVASGSLPPGVPRAAYRDIVLLARSKGARCGVDADDDALELAVGARPTMIKPNLYELGKLVGRALSGAEQALVAGRSVVASGVELVIVSMGADGALFISASEAVHAWSDPVPVASPVGCGDTLLAAALCGWLAGASLRSTAPGAVGAATAKAMKPGTMLPTREEILSKASQTHVREME